MHVLTKDSFLNKAMTNGHGISSMQLAYAEYSTMVISQLASESVSKIAAWVLSHCFAVLGDVSSGMVGRRHTIFIVNPSILLYT
jgi:hypothetical protein